MNEYLQQLQGMQNVYGGMGVGLGGLLGQANSQQAYQQFLNNQVGIPIPPPMIEAKKPKKSCRDLACELRCEIDGWHGDVLKVA